MRAALVVGIDDYQGDPLNACVNDAKSLADVLQTHGNGDPNFSVQLLTTPHHAITRPKLLEEIARLFAADCDICLFYFSGHGIIESTGGYIVTPDAKRYAAGVSMDEILVLANQSRAKDRVILLDCCYSGAAGSPAITGGNLTLLRDGLSVLTACRDSESALAIDGESVFTSLIVAALQGGAADLRGYITAGSIYAYVDQALGPWEQRPIFKTNVTRFTSLRSVAAPIPLETQRKICKYFPSPKDEHPLDPSYEFTDSRANPDNVAIMNDLQKYTSVGLVVPVGEEHMYFAAMNSKSCRLTALGHQYWRLVKARMI